MLRTDKHGAPIIMEINGRRYTICGEKVHFHDGSPVRSTNDYCGELIDVTDAPGIKVTDSCGNADNHIIGGIDAVVLP